MALILRFVAFSALLIGITGVSASAATGSKEDKGPIPADLFFVPVAIPADENVIMDWRKAAQYRVPLNEKEKKTILYAWNPNQSRPSSEDLGGLDSWLERNRTALDLFDASLRKPKAQWPEHNPQNEQPELYVFNDLIRARLLEADEFGEGREFNKSADSLLASLHLANTGLEADGALIHYLIASAGRTLVQGGILRLASRAETPVPVLERLLKGLPRLDYETNIYDHVLKVEFTLYAYPTLDLRKLVEQCETNTTVVLFPEEFQRPFKVLLDRSLVFQHPRPIDAVQEIQRTIRFYRIYRTNVAVAWTNRNDAVSEEREEIRKQLLEDIKPLMDIVAHEPLPLSRQSAQKARAAYLQIEDPIGRIFCCNESSLTTSDARVFKSRTEREVTRAILGSLIFERRKGQLPRSLDQLVEEHILDSIPMDYFSDKPLIYSRERVLIWSVGEDGIDNGGNGNAKVRWLGDDAVWEIPKIK